MVNLVLTQVDEGELWLDHNAENGTVDSALKGNLAREKAFTKLMKQEINENDICFDIGGNIGYYTMIMSHCTNGDVYCFEPNPELKNQLIMNMDEFGNNIRYYDIAFSNKNDTIDFYVNEKSNLSSPEEKNENDRLYQVSCMTIDNFCNDYDIKPNFIKMDVEGHEIEILQGMENLIRTSKKLKILMELHSETYTDKHNFKKELKKLFNNGFKIKHFVSAGSSNMKDFYDLRYKEIETIETDNVLRRIFGEMKEKDALDITSRKPQITRSILLVKDEK